MLLARVINIVLAIELPSLRISPHFFVLIISIIILHAAATPSGADIQSIGFGTEYSSELVFWAGSIVGSQDSKVKQKRLTKAEQSQFKFSEDLKNILVGLILGDLFVQKQRVNARLCFKQGLIHKDYLEHLYMLFKDYCSNAPVITNRSPDIRTGNIYNSPPQ